MIADSYNNYTQRRCALKKQLLIPAIIATISIISIVPRGIIKSDLEVALKSQQSPLNQENENELNDELADLIGDSDLAQDRIDGFRTGLLP